MDMLGGDLVAKKQPVVCEVLNYLYAVSFQFARVFPVKGVGVIAVTIGQSSDKFERLFMVYAWLIKVHLNVFQ